MDLFSLPVALWGVNSLWTAVGGCMTVEVAQPCTKVGMWKDSSAFARVVDESNSLAFVRVVVGEEAGTFDVEQAAEVAQLVRCAVHVTAQQSVLLLQSRFQKLPVVAVLF